MASSAISATPTSSFIANQKDLCRFGFCSTSQFSIHKCKKSAIPIKIISVMTPQQSERRSATTGSVKTALTLTEKIMARASEKPQLSPGENVWINVDILMTHDVGGPGSIGIFKKEFGENAKVLIFLLAQSIICMSIAQMTPRSLSGHLFQRRCALFQSDLRLAPQAPGDNLRLDVLSTFNNYGLLVWNREKLVIIPDHYIFTNDERANRNVDILRDFCTEQNIKYFYDIKDLSNFKVNPNYKGICHVALAQEGHCRPGEVLLGTDSHTCTAGAFGQFATGIGHTDAGFVMGTGKLLLKVCSCSCSFFFFFVLLKVEVPPTLRFVMDGEMPDYLLAKDLILQIIGEISVSGATYKAMEFTGTTVESLTMEERMTLCNMVVEAGGKNGVVPADSTTFKYLEDKTSVGYEPVYSDEKAR
ncbi:hypothetical protein EZV62_001011 [Acer yangbiense]|uniref:Aconitase/3-isopropylmalate dehydratase large subunit alpha/beta/alpha domain-containing protein n=1 Tax=Acer yangbiense TaxID=1000413 RepID=A0A5C7IV68_9ROSI|nr:hypothetical protein EZV62_001011 [Acer yangbiense]